MDNCSIVGCQNTEDLEVFPVTVRVKGCSRSPREVKVRLCKPCTFKLGILSMSGSERRYGIDVIVQSLLEKSKIRVIMA